MKEQSKHRLGLITDRYAARRAAKHEGDLAAFDDAFRAAREAVMVAVLEDVAAELRRSGHAAHVTRDAASETPSIELHLGIRGAGATPGSDLVGFSVVRRRQAPEVLAYLVVRPPAMDLVRFAAPADITADEVEQLVVDAVEHVFACRAT